MKTVFKYILIFTMVFPSFAFAENSKNKASQKHAETVVQNGNNIKTDTLSVEKLFALAVNTYAKAKNQADYLKAASYFEAIAQRGIKHEDLYYNLGNAYFKAQKYGLAVYNYERALKLHPGYGDAKYNLKTTRQIIAGRFKDNIVSFNDSTLWIKAVNWLDLHLLSILFATIWFVFFGLLIYLYFIEKGLLRLTVITFTVFVGITLFIVSLLFFGRINYEKSYKYGIVLPGEVSVKDAPQTASNSSFKLHAGLKVRLGTEEKAWIKIILPNGMEGWVEKKNVGRL